MAIRFETHEFEFAHGRKPRGRGLWAFEIGGETFWAKGSVLFSQAKLQAAREARQRRVEVVKVLS